MSMGLRLDQTGIKRREQDAFMSRYLRVPRRSDKEKTAMDSGILDITFTLSSEFLTKISRVLILDVLDNRFPTIVIKHEFEYCFGSGVGAKDAYQFSLFTWSP